MQNENFFSIAELDIKICFAESPFNGMHLIPSLEPFREKNLKGELFFQLSVDDTLRPYPKEKRKRIRAFGLNNALMLIFAFAGSKIETLLLHASLVRQNGYGYAFIAKSGTGKSTQVSMWLRYLSGCDLMNDDNPILRIIDDTPYIYGSPWSGKTPCYRNVKAKLGAITRIDRAQKNYVEKLSPAEAFASILPSCSSMKWDLDIFNNICNTISHLVELSDIYTLHCLPNREAAIVCNQAIRKA